MARERNYDVRTIERYLREGVIDRDEYQEHLDDLPDVADKAKEVEAEFVEGVLDDEEDEVVDEEAGDEEATDEENEEEDEEDDD